MPLFQDFTTISHPSEAPRTAAIFCVHLRASGIPRLAGEDGQCILYIGYGNNLRKRLNDFLSSARNGTMGLSEGRTLFYYRHRSPGIAALFGDDIASRIYFSYKEIRENDLLTALAACMEEYIGAFGEPPPLNGDIPFRRKRFNGTARRITPFRGPAIRPFEDWTHIESPAEIGWKVPTVYCVYLDAGTFPRWLKADPRCILDIGEAADTRDRLDHFLRAARTGRARHSEGQSLWYFMKVSPGLRAMLGDDMPAHIRFCYKIVKKKDLLSQESRYTDGYIYELGELPPLNVAITGKRKRIREMRRELGMIRKRN